MTEGSVHLPRAALTVAALALLTAAPADAATMIVDKACYQERELVNLRAGPFTRFGAVTVIRDGLVLPTQLRADAAGIVSGQLFAPVVDPLEQRRFTLVATDSSNPALTASVMPVATQLKVTVRPAGARPATRRRIRARGFTEGGTLYAHVVRRRSVRNVRIGRLRMPCGTLTTRKRLFRRDTRNGTYRVQFDTRRRFKRTTAPRVTFRVRIFTVFRPQGSAASTAERWLASR